MVRGGYSNNDGVCAGEFLDPPHLQKLPWANMDPAFSSHGHIIELYAHTEAARAAMLDLDLTTSIHGYGIQPRR